MWRAAAALVLGVLAGCAGPGPEAGTGAGPPAAGGWRLVVLGVAQDGGLPHLGCRRPECEAARRGERRREKVACLGLTDGTLRVMVDATPDFPAQVDAMGGALPDALFLTHAHIGHYTGLVHLGKEVRAAKGVPVHATARMREFLARNGPWSALVTDGNIDLRDNAEVAVGGLRVRALPVPHRDEFSDTVGYLLEGPRARALFVPDIDRWDLWDRDLRSLVESVDYAFLDGTFFSPDELPNRDISRVRHPLMTETMDRLEGLGGRVWFLHLNHTNPAFGDPSLVERRGFHVAREGMELPL